MRQPCWAELHLNPCKQQAWAKTLGQTVPLRSAFPPQPDTPNVRCPFMRFRSVKRSVLARPLLALFVFATLSIAMAQTAPTIVNFRSQSALVTSSDSPGGAVTGDFNEDGRVD